MKEVPLFAPGWGDKVEKHLYELETDYFVKAILNLHTWQSLVLYGDGDGADMERERRALSVRRNMLCVQIRAESESHA